MKTLNRILGIVFATMSFMTTAASTAQAATIIVNSAWDGPMSVQPGMQPPCRFRDAINAANTNMIVWGCAKGDPRPAIDTILFNIGGDTPTIRLSRMLPEIIEPVIIQGDSFGATRVELDGSNASLVASLTGERAHGLFLIAGNSTIRKLVINRFNGNGIVLATDSGGGRIGEFTPPTITDPEFPTDTPCFARSEPDCPPGQGGGIPDIPPIVGGGGGNRVIGCLIGTDYTGTVALGNGSGIDTAGIVTTSDSNIIGGTTSDERNVISGNHGHGIILGDIGQQVRGNYIGTDVTGALSLGNQYDGINIAGGEFSLASGAIGANQKVTDAQCGLVIDSSGVVLNDRDECGNRIAFNGRNGISAGFNRYTFLSNSIFTNGALGIDVNEFGLTPNDSARPRNFPELTNWQVKPGIGGVLVSGSITNSPNRPVIIQFFHSSSCNPSNHGEGRTYVGSITRLGNGGVSFSFTQIGGFVTATATTDTVTPSLAPPARAPWTSEFSACFSLSGPPATPTN